MSKINDGGPAFPNTLTELDNGQVTSGWDGYGVGGMSLRDWFAGQVLCGLIAKEGCSADAITDYATGGNKTAQAAMFVRGDAARAYLYADAMLAERDKPRD